MDKRSAGLIGAMAALGTAGVVQAAPPPADQRDVLQANSYADLLEPIPNAVALLKAADEATPSPSTKANIQLAQAHHHHHHHSYSRRRHRHHHHHHHHH